MHLHMELHVKGQRQMGYVTKQALIPGIPVVSVCSRNHYY